MLMPAPDEFFQGKYKIVEVIGKGGFAHVYRAIDVDVGRDVAIKVLSPQGPGYSEQIESRFMREARVIASLQDPHTITMFEFGRTESGLLFMVFEYVKGVDLSHVLEQRGALPPGIVEHILRQLLSALNEAHQKNVLHRDIKPPNIIVFQYMDDPWRVKLIDFGIAKPMASPTRDLTQLTRDGAVIGTPRYMAPEQFYGEELTERTDIYALGLVAHEMLIGKPAISGKTTEEVLRSALSVQPIRLPVIPGAEALTGIIDRMTERNETSRFGTSMAVLSALDAARRSPPGRVVTAPQGHSSPPTLLPDASRSSVSPGPDRRGLWMVVGTAAAALILVAGLAALLWDGGSPSPSPSPRPVPRKIVRVNDLVRSGTSLERPPAQAPDVGGRAPEPSASASGCGTDPGFRGSRPMTLRIGFEKRRYWIHIPRDYDKNLPHEVVLIFHNAMNGGDAVIEDTKFDAIAEREGLVLVAPESLDATQPWFGVDDVEVTRQALREVAAIACVDENKLYALGHGGGGNFAVRLRCELPLSAVAISASGEYQNEQICEGEPTPLIRLFGEKDKHVPAAGGKGCFNKSMFRSADEINRQWRERNGTDGGAKRWVKERGGKCTLWTGEAAYASCPLDGGHDWPDAEAKFEIPGCEEPPPDFPMADTVWRFFSEHGRPLEMVEPADESADE